MFSIGEFSKITGLTVKTLRYYHEQGILIPSRVEAGSGYRSYEASKIETARMICALRELGFSIAEISEILSGHNDDADILTFLESRKRNIQERLREDRRIVRQLDAIITRERDVLKMGNSNYNVEEKSVDTTLVASIRFQGKYRDCGTGFAKLGRAFGRHICGKPMMLIHDEEYREDDANFETLMPIKKGESTDEITVRELPGGTCLADALRTVRRTFSFL